MLLHFGRRCSNFKTYILTKHNLFLLFTIYFISHKIIIMDLKKGTFNKGYIWPNYYTCGNTHIGRDFTLCQTVYIIHTFHFCIIWIVGFYTDVVGFWCEAVGLCTRERWHA
jgi:hypothetical protein